MALLEAILMPVSYAVAAVLPVVVSIFIYRPTLDPLRNYPGPFLAKFTNVYGGVHAARQQLHLKTYEDLKKYGPMYRQGPDRLVFNTVKAVHDIYLHPKIVKSRLYLQTQYESDHNVFGTMDKQKHQTKRKIYGRLLSDRNLRSFEPTIHAEIGVFLRQLQNAPGVVDMSALAGRLTTDVAGQIAFGQALGTQTTDRNRILPSVMTSLLGLANLYMAWPTVALLHKVIELLPESRRNFFAWRSALESIISGRTALPKHARHDIYSIVSEDFGEKEEIPPKSMGEVWGEATFVIPAGGLTTSTVISAAFFYLSRHPQAYKHLAAEVRAAFPDGASIKNGPELIGLPYLRAVIDETLRMAPATTVTTWREEDPKSTPTEPFVVDGHVVPRGTQVGVNGYCIMHNENYFPEPFAWRPERWLDSEEKHAQTAAAFIPFAVGSASCLGKGMAYLELSLVLAKTLWYFDFERAPGDAGRLGGGGGSGGSPAVAVGRGRADEFQLYDALIADHSGPSLVFTPRGDYGKDLVEAA